jgi:GNAT superfamily N-acetyltransferase
MTRLRRLARATSVTIQHIREDGLVRTARRAARAARVYGLRNAVLRAETAGRHWKWYRLELSELVRHPLPSGMELRRCPPADVPLFARVAPMASRDAARRLAAGGIPWLVLADGQPVFACWSFTERTPYGQARRGWLQLPEHVASLKDVVTAEGARGRGIGPAAMSTIADALAGEGVVSIIARVEDDNLASRRLHEKLGYRPLAPDDPMSADFARQFSR